ncbi:MAG: enolase C-terminal domain-like protein, partial [Candidatus Omnitrophota bacterium]|nr:enolase C-terminal domain-like protein [Candidatus Omnitrophota bacterium]
GGISGFGESLPRQYVTGEDQASVISALGKVLPSALSGMEFNSFRDAADFCGSFNILNGSAKCAVEMALLDAAGKVFNCPITDVFDKQPVNHLRYSAAIGNVPPIQAGLSALKCRLYGFENIKLKVGDAKDIARLKAVRIIAGVHTDLRLDANGAWSAIEAIERLDKMRIFNFSVIEQPVKKGDIASMRKISSAIPEPVMADESMCTIEDAVNLAEARACKMFNIRLSKCGGIINSLKIARIAKAAGISYQLGCQVGESGVLSAAGRHFVSCVEGARYLEGSYAKFLLAEDMVREDVSFGYGGRADMLKGPGLGVMVDEHRLKKYIKNKLTIG